MRTEANTWLSLIFVSLFAATAGGIESAAWHNDYSWAVHEAKRTQRMLLVYLHDPAVGESQDPITRAMLADNTLRSVASSCVLVRVPLSVQVCERGRLITLSRHAAFAELGQQPGIAIIDYRRASAYHGHVISIYPLSLRGATTPRNLRALLTLPDGSLTQRTMILAVRIHPEYPASTDGAALPFLMQEAESQARHQARIRLQGHHNWDWRHGRISLRLRLRGVRNVQEVVAESWPNKGLVAAAVDCVHSWRQSSGHWNAVRSHHTFYGYDIQQGSNGVWYATGIFANR